MTRYFALALLMALLVLPMSLVAPDASIRREPIPLSASDEGGHRPQAISENAAREIDRLIQQLSSSSFAEREAATRRLKRIGNPAVVPLRAAGTGIGADLELRRRSELLVDKILTKDLPQRFGESIAAVEKVLPSGWSILRTVSGSTPPDWWTDDPKAGFLVEARNGEEVLQIWFLPLDWIGIRKTRHRAWGSVYGQGIRTGDKYKTITFVADDKLHERFGHRLGSQPTLINGGYSEALRIFAGKLRRADRIAAALVRKHCHTSKQFNEAISSLNDLGVPARNLFLRSARYTRGQDRGRYTSILGLLGGEDAIGLLCDTATDLEVSAHDRHYAIMDLERHQDERIGPTLHKALMQMPDGEGLDCVVKALTHRRYKPAEADLLALFQRLPDDAYAKNALAQALAAFRCKEAIPELRRLRQKYDKEHEKHKAILESLDLALLRLTGDWGEAGERARLHVLSPQQPCFGEKMELTVHLENKGTEPIESLPLPREMGLRVDGEKVFKEENFILMGPGDRLDPGDVRTFTCDLTPYVKTPGRHQVQYVDHGARSNVVAFTVRAAKP